MIIGYDGKRAFQNKTGLGNYSRSLVSIMASCFAQHQYILFAPKQTSSFNTSADANLRIITPKKFFYKKFPTLWRRAGMVKDIVDAGVDIYHGLSNELPRGIEKMPVKTVVTIHDLIFERFAETYNFDERYVHRWKIMQACKNADAVIAISKQTRDDLVNLYKIAPEKIFICYQSCNPVFEMIQPAEEKALIKKRYQLPDRYFLFVSSITPRKNLAAICQAMILLKDELQIPLVIIGDGKNEKEKIKRLMQRTGLQDQLIFLNELTVSKENPFETGADFPAIYQQALALIYPSVFEGFGLPILEALWSGLPVICSNTSSLPEVGGDAALYFAPQDYALLANHMKAIAGNESLVADLQLKGFEQVKKFTSGQYAQSIMNVYGKVL